MAIGKQSSVLLYLIMLLGLALGFLYQSQTDPAASVPAIDARFQLTGLRGLDTLRIDYSLLSSDQFRQLQAFGPLRIQPQGGGKTNPFQ